jgi:hypothetical protein
MSDLNVQWFMKHTYFLMWFYTFSYILYRSLTVHNFVILHSKCSPHFRSSHCRYFDVNFKNLKTLKAGIFGDMRFEDRVMNFDQLAPIYNINIYNTYWRLKILCMRRVTVCSLNRCLLILHSVFLIVNCIGRKAWKFSRENLGMEMFHMALACKVRHLGS